MAKRQGERSKLGRGKPRGKKGRARSKKSVRTYPRSVNPAVAIAAVSALARRSIAAKASAAHRKLARVEEELARSQAAEVRREIEADRKKRVRKARKDLDTTIEEVDRIRRKQRKIPLRDAIEQERKITDLAEQVEFAKHPGAEQRFLDRQKILTEVKLGRELLGERITKFYNEQKAEGKVLPLSPKHLPGKTWRYESSYRKGYILDRKVGKILDRNSFEDVIERMTKAAEQAAEKQPIGKLYMSMSFFEYGRGLHGYPIIKQDEFGDYGQTFDGTGALSPASSVLEFEMKVRERLLDRLSTYGENHVTLLDGFQVKAFYDRSPQEIKEYQSTRRAEKRALRKKGKK